MRPGLRRPGSADGRDWLGRANVTCYGTSSTTAPARQAQPTAQMNSAYAATRGRPWLRGDETRAARGQALIQAGRSPAIHIRARSKAAKHGACHVRARARKRPSCQWRKMTEPEPAMPASARQCYIERAAG